MDIEKLQLVLQKTAEKVQRNAYISAITNGLISAMPVTIIGALGSLINGLPFISYQNFLVNTGLKQITSIPTEVTTNLLALYVVYLVAIKFVEGYHLDGIPAGIISLMSFLIVTPYIFDEGKATFAIQSLPVKWLGGAGIFTSFIVALVSAKIYTIFNVKGWIIKMPEGVPPTVAKSFSGLVPGFIITILWLIVRYIFVLSPMGDIHSTIFTLIATPLTRLGGTFTALLIAIILVQILWLFGVHGGMVVYSVLMPILTPLTVANLAAYNEGANIPNLISTSLFGQIFFMGAGGTLGLAILMIRAKSDQYRVLGKLAIIPNIFGINEPILFGLPVIMNFSLAIPFLITPILITILSYIGMKLNLLPLLPGLSAPLGTPVIISGMLAGGWRWAIFQTLMVCLSVVVYYPFFKALDQMTYQQELEMQESLEN